MGISVQLFLLWMCLLGMTLHYNNFNQLKNDMEIRVQRLAKAVQAIYKDKCLQQDFQCPVQSFNICQGTDERQCLASFPTANSCNGLSRYSKTSGIRIPNSVASFNMSDEMKFFVCKTAQNSFEQVFQQLIQQNNKRYAWIGVGSNTGAHRVSPGFKYAKEDLTESCKNYDPRLRPWFAQNVYNRKKMVILVQNSRNIHATPNRYPSIQMSLRALLKTASPGDLFNVIEFSDSARPLLSSQQLKLVSLSQQKQKFSSNPQNQNLDFYTSLSNNITKSPKIQANYRQAIELGLKMLQNSHNTNPELQNIIVMLAGFKATNYSYEMNQEIIEVVSQKQLKLGMDILFFGFGVKMLDTQAINMMMSLSCKFDGMFIPLTDITYQSMFLDQAEGFYEYLIQGNIVNKAAWTDFYEDAFGLGQMVSVVRPSYYVENNITRLIAVSGVDVLMKQLTVYKNLEQIHTELQSTRLPFTRNITPCQLQTIRRDHRCSTKCPLTKFCHPKLNTSVQKVIRTPVDNCYMNCCQLKVSSNTGLIVGLVVGLGGGVMIIGFLVWCLVFRRKKKSDLEKTYADIFMKFKDFDQTRVRSDSQISDIKE